ncbi:phosphohydrolase [Aeromicrobium sp. A1-2]|nr:phosphohydrolase [Aeromicrobium sp. A1-2]
MDANQIARRAHAGQVDKLGVDYIHHVEAVADGLAAFDLDLQIAGMLHDVVEDSDITLDDLRSAGVSERTLRAIELVSRNLHPELDYLQGIERVCESYDATLVKISDNAHNSLPARIEALGGPPHPRYAAARSLLYTAVRREDVELILRRANPALMAELT